MGRPTSTVGIVSLFLFLAATLAGAPLTPVHRQVTGTRTNRIEIGEEELGDGAVLTMRATSGETYRIDSVGTGSVIACTFDFLEQRTSRTVRRGGTSLWIEGTVRGRPV